MIDNKDYFADYADIMRHHWIAQRCLSLCLISSTIRAAGGMTEGLCCSVRTTDTFKYMTLIVMIHGNRASD